MTIRRINYTDRHRIDKGDVQIRLVNPNLVPVAFTADLALPTQKLPGDARIFIEAYRQTTRMRFDFGTVASPGFPGGSATLTEFSNTDAVLFAVKVTGVTGNVAGILLADRDGISATSADDKNHKEPLLPADSADLGQELWRLDFANSGPVLLFNSRLADWRSVAADPQIKAVTYAAILRTVLARILILDNWVEDEDEDRNDWHAKWLAFAKGLPGVAELEADPTPADKWEWIETAAAAFARNRVLLSHSGLSIQE